ncbi:tetranectin-like protein [Armigeres subalbatus]|uniref:tetranectin-like protein n=1 Tax=Armigeres subalbatus TaxID=124917 RepID=UPI002ED3F12D
MQLIIALRTVISQLLLAAVSMNSHNSTPNKYILMNVKEPFFKAWRNCQFYGLQLASVTSPEDNRMLSELVNMPIHGNSTFWLAGTDIGREAKWLWITTNKLVVLYSHWGGMAPEYDDKQNCMAAGLFVEDKTLWADIPCEESHQYVCQESSVKNAVIPFLSGRLKLNNTKV